ncbi:MAG: hypothetical protein MHMPM18_004658 [Marteilia pararefringens]
MTPIETIKRFFTAPNSKANGQYARADNVDRIAAVICIGGGRELIQFSFQRYFLTASPNIDRLVSRSSLK